MSSKSRTIKILKQYRNKFAVIKRHNGIPSTINLLTFVSFIDEYFGTDSIQGEWFKLAISSEDPQKLVEFVDGLILVVKNRKDSEPTKNLFSELNAFKLWGVIIVIISTSFSGGVWLNTLRNERVLFRIEKELNSSKDSITILRRLIKNNTTESTSNPKRKQQ